MNKIIIGIDPSLRSTGICIMKTSTDYETHVIKPKELRGIERLDFIKRQIENIIKKYVGLTSDTELIVAIEDYGFCSVGRNFELGELGGVIKIFFYEFGIPECNIRKVGIGTWKKEVVGNGRAKKEEIAYYVKNILGQEFKTQDECDSFCIAEYIRRQL